MDKVTTLIVEHARAAEQHRRRAALRAVASLELAKGVVVLLLGFGAVSLVHKDAWDVAEAVLHFLRVNPDHHDRSAWLSDSYTWRSPAPEPGRSPERGCEGMPGPRPRRAT